MSFRRVAVTGLGVLCGCGRTVAEFRESLRNGRPGFVTILAVDMATFRFTKGAEVTGFNPAQHFEPSQGEMMDRFAQMLLVAAREAVGGAGIEWTPETCERTAVVTGSSIGGQPTEDAGYSRLFRESLRLHPLTIPRIMPSSGASHIAMQYGITGPAYTVTSACSSSSHAIGQAFQMVRRGDADLAIAGGSEAPFTEGMLRAWEALRVVSADTCRPFSKERSGMVLGEGGGVLVLEPLDAAQARGATILGEICGFGMSSDAHHITQPSAAGAALAMKRALLDAGLGAEQVGYINAHGTGTQSNDPIETRAIHDVFQGHAARVAVSSTKSMHGHALAAAGALEAAATVLALGGGWLPPTANFLTADPACDLDVIPNTARNVQVEYAMSNSFAFGGLNAVLVFRASNR